jgi:hypothetical protein
MGLSNQYWKRQIGVAVISIVAMLKHKENEVENVPELQRALGAFQICRTS